MDILLEEIQKSDSEVRYPPDTAADLLRIYLIPNLSDVARKTFVAYFLMDLLHLMDNDDQVSVQFNSDTLNARSCSKMVAHGFYILRFYKRVYIKVSI